MPLNTPNHYAGSYPPIQPPPQDYPVASSAKASANEVPLKQEGQPLVESQLITSEDLPAETQNPEYPQHHHWLNWHHKQHENKTPG